MEAISRHLESFVEVLFEDFFQVPYYSVEMTSSEALSLKQNEARVRRFELIANVPLSIAELRLLLRLLGEALEASQSLGIDVADCAAATSAEIRHLSEDLGAPELSLKDILEWPHPSAPCALLLQRLSLLLALLEERVCRGASYSSIWARLT